MNVLWVIEGNSKSANYKIARKLLEYLTNYNSSVALFLTNKYVETGMDIRRCNLVSFIGSYSSETLAELAYDIEWKERTKLAKLLYLLWHPCLSFEFFKKYLSCRKSLWVKQLEAICLENSIDVVIGTVFPYEIATLISKSDINAKKILIQLDPYVNNYTLSENTIADRIIEEDYVLNKIDTLFTTSIIIKEIKNTHASVKSKIVELEFPEIDNINNDDMLIKKDLLLNKQENDIILLHAGSLYGDIRNPRHLVDLLQVLPSNYKLVLAGNNTDLINNYDYNVKDRIIDLGLIDQHTVTLLMEETDILVCFNNSIDNQVPSKLFECIATGKPFINLCQLQNCPSLPYVKDYENAINVFVGNINGDEIVKFVQSHIGTKIEKEKILQRYYKHTFEYVANQIEEVINSVNF